MTRHLVRWVLVLVLLSARAVSAADLTGTWQGALKAGKDLRLVFRIATVDGGQLAATMYSIDQGGQAFASSAATAQGTSLHITIPSLDGMFDGQVFGDGNSIAGTWKQGGMSFPLTLVRATADTAWAIPAPPPALTPMAADAPLTFEVATIKPSRPEAQGKGFLVKGRQVTTMSTSLSDLITFAYDLHPQQLVGGPAWLATTRFDITAQPEAQGQPSLTQLKAMIQRLLTDRFKLALHKETRELSVYGLVLANGGHKLTRSANQSGLPTLLFRSLGVLPVMSATLADFASVMQSAVLDRPVRDQTGLTGRWDFTLTWTPDDTQFRGMAVRVPPPPADGSGSPGLFTAMSEQLGLRLDATKAQVDVLVIDRADPPSDN